MTAAQFRKIALSLHGAVEASHMGHPDFRANGKVFATLGNPAQNLGMVKLPLDRQKELLQTDPAAFYPATGAWGRAGCTMVRLECADEEKLGEALTAAWQVVRSKASAEKQPRKP